MKNHRFFMLLAVTAVLVFSTGVEVQAAVSGTLSLARHYDLRPLTSLSFNRNNCAIGDLNNDGLIDYLMYSNSKRMAAFADDGAGGLTKLWEYSGPGGIPEPPEKYQYHYSSWDIDNDGAAEVIGAFASTSGYLELRVLNGATGAVEHSLQTTIENPTSDDDIYETRCYVTVANFRGLSTPQDIVVLTENDGFGEIWAYNDSLTLLWDTTGDPNEFIYAHYPWTYDIDGDGKDELVGSWIFDDDGTKLAFISDPNFKEWRLHLDRGYIGELDASNPGVDILSSLEYYEARMHDASGNLLWGLPYGNGNDKIIVAGEFSSAHDGPEVTTYYAPKGGAKNHRNKTYRCEDGSEIVSLPVVDSSSSFAVDFDGDRTKDEAYHPKRGGFIWDPMDGDTLIFGASEGEGSPYEADAYTLHSSTSRATGHAADVYGDNREEIIICDDDEILVYTNADTNPDPQASPWGTAIYQLLIANHMSDVHAERAYWPAEAGPPPVYISGLIRESDLTPIEGVLVSADNGGGSDTTDQTGYYEVPVSSGWSGMVTPTKAGWTFEPAYREYTNVTEDQTNQDYTGTPPTPPVYISGLVRESDLTPIEGVLVSADNGGGSDTTDQTGYYEVPVSSGWSGTVTPTKSSWTFEPANRQYTNVTEDQTNQDYTGTYAGEPEIYVYDIGMSYYLPKASYYAAKATVWIKDTELTDIVGATVSGDWSGDVSGSSEGDTGEDGKVTLESKALKGGGLYIFTVTDVSATGYTYNPSLNNETSDEITAP